MEQLSGLQSLLGRYVFESQIGEGAFAKVYIAQPLGRHGVARGAKVEQVAIKRMELAASEVSAEDIEQEISLLRAMDHQNITKLRGVYSMDSSSVICIVMELSRCTLTRLLVQDKIDESCFLYIIYCICEALVYLHGIKVIHRDLKPDNVLVNADGLIKLSDFGVSAKVVEQRTLARGKKGGPKFDGRTTFTGTPSFLAPEVVRVFKGLQDCYSFIADIFSYGCVAYYCLFGRSPVVGTSLEDVMKQLMGKKQFSSQLDSTKAKTGLQIPTKVLAMTKKCLLSDPKKRPSAIECRAILLQFKDMIEKGNKYTALTVRDVQLPIKNIPKHLDAFNDKSKKVYKTKSDKLKEAKRLERASISPTSLQKSSSTVTFGNNVNSNNHANPASAPDFAQPIDDFKPHNGQNLSNYQKRRHSFTRSGLPSIPENYSPQSTHQQQINGMHIKPYPQPNQNHMNNQLNVMDSNVNGHPGSLPAPIAVRQNMQHVQNCPRPTTMLNLPENNQPQMHSNGVAPKASTQNSLPAASLAKSESEKSNQGKLSKCASKPDISYRHCAISNTIKHANASQIHACFFCSQLVLVSTSTTTMADLYYLDANQQRSFNVGGPTQQIVKVGKCDSTKDGCLLLTTKQKLIFYNVSKEDGSFKLRHVSLESVVADVQGICRSRASDNVLVFTKTEIRLFEEMSTSKLCTFPDKTGFAKSQICVTSVKELGSWCTNYTHAKAKPRQSFILMGLSKLKNQLVTFKVGDSKVEFIIFHDLIDTKINFVDCAVDERGQEVFSIVTENKLLILNANLQLTQQFDLSKTFPSMFIVGLCGTNRLKMLAISQNNSQRQKFWCFDMTAKRVTLEPLSVSGKIGQKLKLIHWNSKMFILLDENYMHFFVSD